MFHASLGACNCAYALRHGHAVAALYREDRGLPRRHHCGAVELGRSVSRGAGCGQQGLSGDTDDPPQVHQPSDEQIGPGIYCPTSILSPFTSQLERTQGRRIRLRMRPSTSCTGQPSPSLHPPCGGPGLLVALVCIAESGSQQIRLDGRRQELSGPPHSIPSRAHPTASHIISVVNHTAAHGFERVRMTEFTPARRANPS